ncbi:uncharacterized protein A4U43_C07F20970 [Asparagus officinalis]|uniref:Major facilitator superfamily (MFS) profile domain-containing protein n=1 Tax=Asparagus officinalis TaxID=4686 RepID=A0A5P1EGN4_ASPOF|nr:uncharacterized protein A4U43_C07F20970 [Asparagus officinalis]
MATGAVISSRSFGSFLATGKKYQAEGSSSYNRELYLCSITRRHPYFVRQAIFRLQPNSAIDRVTKKRLKFFGEIERLYSNSWGNFSNGSVSADTVKQRSVTKIVSFLSSDSQSSGWLRPRKLDSLGLSDNLRDKTEYHLGTRTHVDFNSEPYEITGSQLDSVNSSEVPNEAVLLGRDVKALQWEQHFPKRWLIVLLCFFAFLLCNMDRVNMSIAILPMSTEFNWNPATVGLIQSSFFWGYLLTQGVAMPAMNNILSKWIPVSERSRSLALVYSGMYLGSVTGLAFSPMLINKFGWPSVFYAFGSLGSVWFAFWQKKAHSSPEEDPELSSDEKRLILGGSVSKEPVSSIPWRLILSKAPVWALIISHFCHNWGTFILLTWMPTYYNQVLKFNLTESGLLCVLPWLTMAVFANIGGWIADTLVAKGLSITTVRKIMQSIGFLGPAFFLAQLSRVRTPALAVLCMACSQGSDAFSQSGLYSNHQDIGPRYAGVLLGLSNTAGVLAGVLGTAATGYILQRGSWDDVFKVSIILYMVGTLVWNFFSTGEKILD